MDKLYNVELKRTKQKFDYVSAASPREAILKVDPDNPLGFVRYARYMEDSDMIRRGYPIMDISVTSGEYGYYIAEAHYYVYYDKSIETDEDYIETKKELKRLYDYLEEKWPGFADPNKYCNLITCLMDNFFNINYTWMKPEWSNWNSGNMDIIIPRARIGHFFTGIYTDYAIELFDGEILFWMTHRYRDSKLIETLQDMCGGITPERKTKFILKEIASKASVNYMIDFLDKYGDEFTETQDVNKLAKEIIGFIEMKENEHVRQRVKC